MSTRPENTLWDVAQLNAAKPTDAQPFSGSHGNQRTEDQALRSAAIRLASSTADPLLKKALLRELTAGSGAANARYLASLQPLAEAKILLAIAKHYGVTTNEIRHELTDPSAEALYEYAAFDRSMAMKIHNDFRNMRLASHSLVAEPRYRDYRRRYKGDPSKMMNKEQWEAKVLGKPKDEGKEKGKAPDKKAPSNAKELSTFLQEAHEKLEAEGFAPGSNGKVTTLGLDISKIEQKAKKGEISYPEAMKQIKPLMDQAIALAKGDKKAPAKGKAPAKKAPAKKAPAKKAPAKKWAPKVQDVMKRNSLLDEDAEELRKHKKSLFDPGAASRMTDQQRMAMFLKKASPETKERMKGMSVKDFTVMLAAIMDEEGGG